jgi:hypothetical protein
MLKEISKEEIPEWPHGNIMLKTYSYGDTLMLADMIEKTDGELVLKNGYKESDVNIFMLAAGIHLVKTNDNNAFVVPNNATIDAKKKFTYDIDKSAAIYLLTKIKEINEVLTDDLKKKLV